MIQNIITQEEAKERAISIIKYQFKPYTKWYELESHIEYWRIHGFNICKKKSIKEKNDLIEIIELHSLVNMRYNPRIESEKMILKELENLEEKDLI